MTAGVNLQTPNLIADLIQLLRDQCSVVGHILSDVLSLQKIEEGKFDLEMAPFSPELLVQNTVDSFRPSLQRKQLKVNVHLQSLDDFLGVKMGGSLCAPGTLVLSVGTGVDAVSHSKCTLSSEPTLKTCVDIIADADHTESGAPRSIQLLIGADGVECSRRVLSSAPEPVSNTIALSSVQALHHDEPHHDVTLAAPATSVSLPNACCHPNAVSADPLDKECPSDARMDSRPGRSTGNRVLIGGMGCSGADSCERSMQTLGSIAELSWLFYATQTSQVELALVCTRADYYRLRQVLSNFLSNGKSAQGPF